MPRAFERMRGLYTPVVEIRRRVFSELARLVVEGRLTREGIDAIPRRIIATNEPHYRCCVFRERAIVRERVRLACGLPLSDGGEGDSCGADPAPLLATGKILAAPLVNVIRIGCERCPEHSIVVTDTCMNCLAHPCTAACPVGAVSLRDGRAHVDMGKCVRCLRCVAACPFDAIVRRGRPCVQACGVDAIASDADGYAAIDQEKCVSCGLCIVSCPFGAIADKSEILPVVHALRGKTPVHAIVAPSFVAQFGARVPPAAVFRGLRDAGFASVVEVAYGADHDVTVEAGKLARLLGEEPDGEGAGFLGTSCCPSWVMMARRLFPHLSGRISDSWTPMVVTAAKVKAEDPAAQVVFIGPCVAKKHEALLAPMNGSVDHVLTFEETAAILVALGIDLAECEASPPVADASGYGRGYAASGGVCDAIVRHARARHGLPAFETAKADTLRECRAMLEKVTSGAIRPRLVEGMACPGGCIGGPGTLAPLARAKKAAERFAAEAGRLEPDAEHAGDAAPPDPD